jgi:SAM-dependent methyltransferase
MLLFVRLNLGSGPRAIPGWINIDRSPNVLLDRFPRLKRAMYQGGMLSSGHMQTWDRSILRADICELPYPDQSVDAIYTSHTLEHLYLDEVRRVLSEAARVLRVGGILRIALPDAEQIARRFIRDSEAGDPRAGWTYNDALLAHPFAAPKGSLGRLRGLLAGHVHRWQPTPGMVEELMRDAGFSDIVRCEYQSGSLPDLVAIENRPESFFLEARRPPK